MNVNQLCTIASVGHYEAKLDSDPQILPCAKVFTNVAGGESGGARGNVDDALNSRSKASRPHGAHTQNSGKLITWVFQSQGILFGK